MTLSLSSLGRSRLGQRGALDVAVSAVVTQTAYRLRNDDGDEAAATWKAAMNTSVLIDVGKKFRIRMLIKESAGVSSGALDLILEFRINGGSWTTMTGSSAVQLVASGTVMDATVTTQQLDVGSYVAGEFDSNGVIASPPTLAADRSTEMEYCCQIDSAQVADADLVELRVTNGGTPLDAYTTLGSLTVNKPEATRVQSGFQFFNDDDGEAASTALAALNTDITLNPETIVQLRVEVSETGGAATGAMELLAYYSKNGGPYEAMTTSTPIQLADSANLTDGEATTQRLGGGGTFVAGEVDEDGAAGTVDLTSEITEMVYPILLDEQQIAHGDTYDVRVRNGADALDTYTQVPRITAETMPLFSDTTLEHIMVDADPKDLSDAGWNLVGTPTLTAQTAFRDSVPQDISAAADWHRVEETGIALTNGDTYTIAAHFKDVDADRVRITLKNDAGTEYYANYTPSTDTWGFTGTAWGTIANTRSQAGPDGTTLIELDFTPDTSETNFRPAISANRADSTSIIVYTFAASEAISAGGGGGGGGGGATITEYLAVGHTAGGAWGAPNNANTTIQANVADAKASPMASIEAALNAASGAMTDTCAIICQDGTFDERVNITLTESGISAAKPIKLISETDRGCTIRGPNTTGDQSPLRVVNGRFVQAHNFVLHPQTQGSDTASFKVVNTEDGTIEENSVGIYGCRIQGTSNNAIKCAAARKVTIEGCFVDADAGNFNLSAIDLVSNFDPIIRYTTVRGAINTQGIQLKGMGLRALVDSCDIEITGRMAIAIGEIGFSRSNRQMPFGGEAAETEQFSPGAECADGEVTNCRFSTTWDHCVWFRGADNMNFHHNWLGGHSTANAIEMLNAKSGMWSDQPRDITGVSWEQFATIEDVAGTANDKITTQCRNITIQTNWHETGKGSNITQQNAGTNTVEALIAAAVAGNVLTAPFGEDGWDRTAIYSEIA